MTNLREGLRCAKCRSLLATLGTYADGSNVWNLDQEQLPTFVQDAVDQVSTRTLSQTFDLLCQPPFSLHAVRMDERTSQLPKMPVEDRSL